MGNSMEVNLCKISKKIEIDYRQSSVKMFFDQSAKCGQDGKKFYNCFHVCVCVRERYFNFVHHLSTLCVHFGFQREFHLHTIL